MLAAPDFSPAPAAALAAALALLAGCAGWPPSQGGIATPMLLAETALERGEYPAAAREYRQAAAASRDTHIAERAARVAFDHGQQRELLAIARDWLGREPTSEVARRFAAVALLELDRRAEATREFRALLRSAYPAPADGFTALQESFGDLRNEVAAAQVLGALAAEWPDLPEAHYAYATRALEAGDSPAALAAAGRALALRPNWHEARWLQARARIAGGDCSRGLQDGSLLAAESTDADRLLYAWLLAACDRNVEARPFFEDLAHGRAARAEALEGLAGLDLDARRFDEAANHYTEMLATGRSSERAFFGLALTADRRGEKLHAVRLYARVMAGARAVQAQLRAYRLLLDAGNGAAAARLLDDFVVAAPEHALAVTAGRAQVLAELGRGDDGLALLARAGTVYPDSDELRYARATVLERNGEADRAISELRAVLQQRPDDSTAQNALGFTLADHGRDLSEAERLIRAALAQRPDSPAIRDSLGWVLHRRGQSAAGLEWLQRAYRADPDPEIAAHIGAAQWALGDPAAAERTWREALQRAPGNRPLQEALEQHLGQRQ